MTHCVMFRSAESQAARREGGGPGPTALPRPQQVRAEREKVFCASREKCRRGPPASAFSTDGARAGGARRVGRSGECEGRGNGRGRRSEAPKNGGECHHTPAALISAPTVEHVKGANNCPSRKTALASRCGCAFRVCYARPTFQTHVDAPARAQLRLEVLVAPPNRPPNLSDASPQ